MANQLDPNDRSSWYFGQISRQEATELLMSEREGGVFLIRDSSSMQGDYVLCVRENSKVSHYIINKLQQNDQVLYRIGDQIFADLPALIEFYRIHYLDTTPLIRPAPRTLQTVVAKYDFKGNDPDDLPFKKGEILTIVSKDEEQWWTARNSLGQIGSVPVPYVQKCDNQEQLHPQSVNNETPPHLATPHAIASNSTTALESVAKKTALQKKLPALARVKQARIPNAYDQTALKLEIGDIIKVTKMNINGQWEGELNGKVGHFPFTHVEFLENENCDIEETPGCD